jgi:hypothetical protein
MIRVLVAATLAVICAGGALAESFNNVRDRDDFIVLVSGKALTRLGVSLKVREDGQIEGRAFGQKVRGAWRWQAGLFCRDLHFGDRDLGQNCQVVQHRGGTLRFISDAGHGNYADLRLK